MSATAEIIVNNSFSVNIFIAFISVFKLYLYKHYRQDAMASPNGSREDDDRKELDKEQKTLLDRKKAVFRRSADNDKELLEIRQKEMNIQKKRQELNEMERMRRTLEDLRNENTYLKAKLQSADDQSATALKSKVESPQEEWKRKKEKICEKEHGGASDVNARARFIEQTAALKKLQEDYQHITVHSKSLEKKVAQLEDLRNENTYLKAKLQSADDQSATALKSKVESPQEHITVDSKTLEKKVAQLEDEIRALREISKETQERQLSEIQPTSSAMQQHQRCAGTAESGGKPETFGVLPQNTNTKLC